MQEYGVRAGAGAAGVRIFPRSRSRQDIFPGAGAGCFTGSGVGAVQNFKGGKVVEDMEPDSGRHHRTICAAARFEAAMRFHQESEPGQESSIIVPVP